MPAIESQFYTFVNHVPQINETDRKAIFKQVHFEGGCLVTRTEQPALTKNRVCTTLINYVDNVMLIQRDP